MLQIAIGRKGKSHRFASSGVEFNQIARNVFEFAFGAILDFIPCAATQFAEFGFHPFFPAVFREFVQRMNRAKNDVTIQIHEFNHFLHGAVGARAHQPAEFTDAMVFVHNVVAHFYLVEFFKRKGEFARAGALALEAISVESVENLVVGKHTDAQFVVDKAFVHGAIHGDKGDIVVAVVEYHAQSRYLFFAVAENVEPIALAQKLVKRLADEIEILVVDALRGALQH